jgi:DNA-binding NtrC family response regulator
MPAAADLLLAYQWPGNVRELRNVAERLVLQDRVGPVPPDALPHEIRDGATVIAIGGPPRAASDAVTGGPVASRAMRPKPAVPSSAMADKLWQRMAAAKISGRWWVRRSRRVN